MGVGKACATECQHVALLSAMARSLAIKTSLRLPRGRMVVFSAALPTGLGLRRIPEVGELASNEALIWYRLVDQHSYGVCHAVAMKGNDTAVMSQTANKDSQAARQVIRRSWQWQTWFSQSLRRTELPAMSIECSFRAASFTALLSNLTTQELLLAGHKVLWL